MRIIPLSNVRNYESVKLIKLPLVINYECPHCEETISGIKVNHTLSDDSSDATIILRCTSCNKLTKFWIPEFSDSKKPSEIFQYGKNTLNKSLMSDVDALPEKLKDAYEETIDVFVTKKWAATSVMCRRTLEGVVYYLNGKSDVNQPLYKALKELPEKVNLSERLIELADGIRKAGNFGAHFDEIVVPDQELATMLVEYIEYLLEFSFVLPKRAEDLHVRLNKLTGKD